MTDPIHPRDVLLDADRRLLEHVRCRGCGYDLHGVRIDEVCPECALAVDHSFSREQLRFADGQWLRTMIVGARLMLLSFGILIALIAAMFLAYLMTYLAGRTPAPGSDGIPMAGAVYLVAMVVALGGHWCLTWREPDHRERTIWTNRAVARWTITAAVALIAGSGVWARWLPAAVSTLMASTTLVLWLIGLLALMRHGMSIAWRMPDDRLAHRTQWILWTVVISHLLFALLNTAPLTGPWIALQLIALVPVFATMFMAIALLVQFHGRLRRIARRT